jgi:hypothetical protein
MILLLMTCAASVILGTKATWFTVVLISGYYLFKYKPKTFFAIIIPGIVAAGFAAIAYWDYLEKNYFAFLVDKYQTMDFYTFWTSNRNGLLAITVAHIQSTWVFINYIVGDASSYVEMDFIDLYFYFGVGTIFYLYIYTQFFFLKDKSEDNKYIYAIWMLMAFVAGHLINSAVVPVFFLLYIFSASTRAGTIQDTY